MIQLVATLPQDYQAFKTAAQWQGFALPEGGLEPPEVLDMLTGWAERLHSAQGWGTWVAVSGAEVVGSLAVKSPAVAGVVEIGYGTAPARRGRGHAAAAVLALLPVLRAYGVTQVTAETAIDNPASGRVMQKAGFAVVGHRHDDEDGDLMMWALGL